MQTKTYFASSVPAALEVARKELGSEAMLLNSKPAPAESRAFGRLEVTFAYDGRVRDEPPRPPDARQAHGGARSADAFAVLDGLRQPRPSRVDASQLDDLRNQIDALRLAISGQAGSAVPGVPVPYPESGIRNLPQGESTAIAKLVRNGISEPLARELAASAARRPGGLATSLTDEVISRLPVAPYRDMGSGETRALAFLGPAGRGKTSSLIKIAVNYGIARRIPVRIYQAGGHGVGCQEQMARYAAILGVPFLACESLESLGLSLNGDGWKGLILIDTPGVSPSNTADLRDLGQFFARRPEIERHLVLRSDTRSADMSYMVSSFSPAGPERLLFTGTEESLTAGAMVETLITTGLGSTFAGTGQQIPDDLEELDIPRLARSVCADRPMAATAAG